MSQNIINTQPLKPCVCTTLSVVTSCSCRYLLMFRPMYKGGCDIKSGRDVCTTTVCVAHSLYSCYSLGPHIILYGWVFSSVVGLMSDSDVFLARGHIHHIELLKQLGGILSRYGGKDQWSCTSKWQANVMSGSTCSSRAPNRIQYGACAVCQCAEVNSGQQTVVQCNTFHEGWGISM